MFISKTEATIIAHEHIDGVILKEEIYPIMSTKSFYPIAWMFYIYHRNQDKDTFLTTIEVLKNGVVGSWSRKYILDEE